LVDLRESLVLDFRRRNREAKAVKDQDVADQGDLGVADDLGDLLHLLSDSERARIAEIDEALDAVDRGAYGVCERCGEPIDMKRLETLPSARYCVDCKEEIEAREPLRTSPVKGKI
jgi:DnaK suppressor protein